MSGPAQVRSTQAIEDFRLALAKFEQRVQSAVEGLDAQLRRAQDWVDHDRPSHWRRETRKAEDAVHQAKVELNRCLMFTVADERPSCREERAALKKAEQRLDYCRGKIERVKRWQQELQHEMLEYQGRMGQLGQLLELEIPRARASLELILRRIAEYQLEKAPVAMSQPPVDASVQPPAPRSDNPADATKTSAD